MYQDIAFVFFHFNLFYFQVLVAVLRNPKLRTATYVLICNLSVTDVLFALGIPFLAITRVTQQWVLGEVVCKSVTYLQFISSICSILTMVTISADRFTRVCFIGKFKLASRELKLTLAAIWITSFAFPVPVVMSQTVKTLYTETGVFTFCGIEWMTGFHPEIYLTCMLIFFFMIPLMVTSVLYYKIWRFVSKSTENISSSKCNAADERKIKAADKQVRMVKMFICIVILFVIMWLPFFILSLLGVHFRQITSTQLTASLILALANTCQNPIIYGYFNYRLRNEFKVIFCEKLCRRKQSSAYALQGADNPSGSRGRNHSSTV